MSLARKYVALKYFFFVVICNDLVHLIARFAHGPMTRTAFRVPLLLMLSPYTITCLRTLNGRLMCSCRLFGPPVPNAYPILLVQEKARGKQEEDMLFDESDELTSWYDSGWLGRDILTQSKNDHVLDLLCY